MATGKALKVEVINNKVTIYKSGVRQEVNIQVQIGHDGTFLITANTTDKRTQKSTPTAVLEG